jgi:OTU domain-containing protein 6
LLLAVEFMQSNFTELFGRRTRFQAPRNTSFAFVSDDFLPFLADHETGDVLGAEEFKKYLHNIAHTKAWGGQVELRALSQHLTCPVEVVQAEGPPMVVGEEFAGRDSTKLVLTYHRHMYGLGEHYNSTKKKI